jgi:molybdate transport system regulatory protein
MSNKKIRYEDALASNATDKRIDILRRLGELGSISEAARSAGVSYKAAWQAIETLTNLAGSVLVEKVVGGAGGGGARLTEMGERLLRASDLLTTARHQVISGLYRESKATDAVHGFSALGLRTSMRNQLPCKIKSLSGKGSAIRIGLELPDGETIHSAITSESKQLLGLHVGQSVLALFKATAVVIGSELPPRSGFNTLSGVVTRVSRSTGNGEVGLILKSGLQLVGFCPPEERLRAKSRALAQIEESGVVIAVTN